MSNAKHTIAVQSRAEFGNNAARRLRKESRIPAVLYSKGKEARALSVDTDEWKVLAGQHGSHVVTLLEGKTEIPALVREVQFNYLKNYVLHIDFQQVDLSQEITVKVPVHAVGNAIGVAHGGVLEQELHELPVTCRPDLLPEAVKVNVAALEIGDVLTVAQIELPEGVKVAIDGGAIAFNVARPAQEEEAPAPAAEETAAAEPEAINEKKAADRAAEKESRDGKEGKDSKK